MCLHLTCIAVVSLNLIYPHCLYFVPQEVKVAAGEVGVKEGGECSEEERVETEGEEEVTWGMMMTTMETWTMG